MRALINIAAIIVKNISFIIIALSFIAFLFPDYFKGMVSYTSIFLGVAMFGMGTSISASEFKQIIYHPKEIIIGCIAQYTIMPLIAYILVTTFKLPLDLALGVILVATCPGGTASNVITHIAKGDVSLSVAMTITSTLISPIVTPTLIYALAHKWVDVSFLAMFKSVLTVILLPVLLGIFANHFAKSFVKKTNNLFPLISALAIILIIAGIIAANKSKIIESGFFVLIIVAIHNCMGFLCGLVLGKILHISYKKTTALSIEIGMQNSGLAMSLALLNFAQNPLATLPAAIFSIWQNIAGSMLANIRSRKNNLKTQNELVLD